MPVSTPQRPWLLPGVTLEDATTLSEMATCCASMAVHTDESTAAAACGRRGCHAERRSIGEQMIGDEATKLLSSSGRWSKWHSSMQLDSHNAWMWPSHLSGREEIRRGSAPSCVPSLAHSRLRTLTDGIGLLTRIYLPPAKLPPRNCTLPNSYSQATDSHH